MTKIEPRQLNSIKFSFFEDLGGEMGILRFDDQKISFHYFSLLFSLLKRSKSLISAQKLNLSSQDREATSKQHRPSFANLFLQLRRHSFGCASIESSKEIFRWQTKITIVQHLPFTPHEKCSRAQTVRSHRVEIIHYTFTLLFKL